ncbi:MAG: molybdenum ABC transporter ATP-binding protein [Calditrichaeota bacterium]|nr:MAG: molybdenum ABC transporter ATP-binding protein [Calditrichota bacterium]
MLKLRLVKTFPNFKLDLDLHLRPAFTALFGPSGSGKTTTLNLIAGLTRPDEGEVTLNERVLFSSDREIDLPPRQRAIGYIFQEGRLFPHLSVRKNLEFGYRNVAASQRKFELEEVAELTGIGRLLDRMPMGLSGGERQRVALARALLASPDYLLLDEPLAALDLQTRLAFLQFLRQLHEKLALPMLYVSHDLSSVLNFAEDVVLLQSGRCLGYAPPHILLDKMAAPPLISRADIANVFEAQVLRTEAEKGVTRIQASGLEFVLPRIDSRAGSKLLLNIPASEIIIALERPANLSASNVVPGRVREIRRLGERILLEVDAGMNFTVEIVPATVTRLQLAPGRQVFLIIKASSFRKLA